MILLSFEVGCERCRGEELCLLSPLSIGCRGLEGQENQLDTSVFSRSSIDRPGLIRAGSDPYTIIANTILIFFKYIQSTSHYKLLQVHNLRITTKYKI